MRRRSRRQEGGETRKGGESGEERGSEGGESREERGREGGESMGGRGEKSEEEGE